MKKIVALIDGSVYSPSVCDHTAWIAGVYDAQVELVHVITRKAKGTTDLSGNIGLGARTALLDELAALDVQASKLAQRRGRAILEDASERLSEAGVSNVETKLRIGEFLPQLPEIEADADLLVLGKRGEGADFEKLHLGSNLERAVRASTKPVLVTARAFSPIKKVMVAVDGGASAVKAVRHLASSPRFSDCHVHLLTVAAQSTGSNSAQQDVEGAAAMLNGKVASVTAEVLTGAADSLIAEKVQTDGFDLLVMGAYGHSRIRTLIIGSTTTSMLRTCRVPVLLFR